MTGHLSHKYELIEMIGVYAGGEIQSILETLEKRGVRCQFHTVLSSFHCWILSARSKLVVLDSALLIQADPEELKNLKETLSQWGILSLIMVHSIEEIKEWRSRNWPGAHFYHGPLTERSLKDKITRMLAERLLLERPGAAVVSDKPYLLSHLGMILRHYGIRMIPVRTMEINEALKIMAPEHFDVVLLDGDAFAFDSGVFLEKLKKTVSPESIPSFPVSEEKGSSAVYAPHRFNELCLKILEMVEKKREMRLKVVCDHRTGLYLPETFLHLAEREMALSSRRGEEFSMIKIGFHDVRAIEEKFGPIFVRELELVFSLFIEHRVRSSDFVAKGFHQGQMLVLFPGLDRQMAHLVGERLRAGFAKAASFGHGSCDGFHPRLEYEVTCYPHDVKSVGELEKVLASSKPGEPLEFLGQVR